MKLGARDISALKNSAYNLLGLGLPLLIALVTIPILIHELGSAKFGILTLIWAIVSYFGVFDLGLGRAVTQRLSAAISDNEQHLFAKIIGTAFALMAALGVFALIALMAVGKFYTNQIAKDIDLGEVQLAIYYMALGMPAVILTSCYRGVLEAAERFDIVNMIRFPMGIFTFAGPVLAIYLWSSRLDIIAGTLVAGRIAALVVHARFALVSLGLAQRELKFDRAMVRPLIAYGGWLTVTNIASPVMTYLDRFIVSAIISPVAVAYYVTAQELVIRISIIPSSIVSVMFPQSAKMARDSASQANMVKRFTILVAIAAIPLSLLLTAFAYDILALWINPAFALESFRILQVLMLAGIFSAIAQPPYTLIQALGHSKPTGVIHLIELPVYCGLVFLLTAHYGILGTACAWLIRVLVDMFIMWWIAWRYISKMRLVP
ncbi:flippase [Microcoleus sp. F10-B2]